MKQDVKKAQDALDYILRTNFESFLQMCFLHLSSGAPYLPNWHIKAIAYQLDRIRRGEITRLIINMPPRYLKSLTVTVAFTAFSWAMSHGVKFLRSVMETISPPNMPATFVPSCIRAGSNELFEKCRSCAALMANLS